LIQHNWQGATLVNASAYRCRICIALTLTLTPTLWFGINSRIGVYGQYGSDMPMCLLVYAALKHDAKARSLLEMGELGGQVVTQWM